MNLYDAWVGLRHGGNLLATATLEALPEPEKLPWGISDRLRTALVALRSDKVDSTTGGALLDVILERVCGLQDGWHKASAVGNADAEKLLDGTVLKPRRRWLGPRDDVLFVFTTSVTRLGVGKGRRPVAQVVEYLRKRSAPLALLTNGAQWRLIWADSDSLAWVEWEADRWLEADQFTAELTVLRRVLSPATLTKPSDSATFSPLLSAIRDTRRGQATLSKELGERVRRAVEALLRSREPLVGPAWDAHASNEIYVAACHFIMRLVVILFAEARELLPVDIPIYNNGYGLRSLLDQLDRYTPERRRTRHSAWPRLLALFRLLHSGSPHWALRVPVYGGDLFRPGDPGGDGVQRALALLETLSEPPDDDVLHRILVLLTRTTQKVREGSSWRTVAAPVDFTELTSEYIGILYEGLLDYELHRAVEQPVVFLNLGDQPALPLDRLEAMDDKALKALVEKAKVKRQALGSEGEDPDQDEADESDEPDDELEEDQPAEVTVETDNEESLDDSRAESRARAIAWGRRAAEAAKLVKRPKVRQAEATALYETQLNQAANQLVADLKLPGELYLVRWGGTRKGAGTFYTRPQLTLPTVRRTLEPLIYRDVPSEVSGTKVRPPEVLLALKVCDPAMGSGSFLVAALRVLTAAVVESLHAHGRIERVNGRTTVRCELLPEADQELPTDGFEERLEAIVRRAVVEHCLYGVDLDPLAVELARVALWVETLDRDLPFTFLDHKLRCGDALVGTWLDRFRDYPLLCFDRQSPDLKYKGVHHPADVWHNALKERRAEAISQQVDLLSGQMRLPTLVASDDELKAAVERVRRLYRDLRAVPAGRPDERARIWRERIQVDPALTRVREAFDTWCALWFWPLDELDHMPLPSQLQAPSEAARTVVSRLREEKRFFHWELEFPDVFTEEDAGFDAIVGNPPWEIQKPNSKEFFCNHDPLYRAYGKQEALEVQKNLFQADDALENQWLTYSGDFKARANFVKHVAEPHGDGLVADHGGGSVSLQPGQRGKDLHKTWRVRRARYRGTSDPAHPFRHQGSADLNTYKMFTEMAHALLRVSGQLGLVVPSGLYTDKGTGDLRRLLLEKCEWRWLYGFENRKGLFDIHRSFKFCLVIARKGGTTETIQAAFMRHDLEDWADAKGVLLYPAERVTAFSPKSLSVLEIRFPKDLEVLTKLYSNGVLLGDEGPSGWGIKYATEFHMTNDSKLFIPRDKAEEQGYKPDIYGRWVNEGGDVLLPLYEGRMIGQFDFSEKGWVTGKGRSAVWRDISWSEKHIEPQFVMRQDGWQESLASGRTDSLNLPGAKLTYMAIGSATNRRSMFATLVRDVPCGNSVPTLQPKSRVVGSLVLAAIMNSFCYDFLLRSKLGGLNLNYFVISETSITRPADAKSAMLSLAAGLCLCHHWFAPTWVELAQISSAHAVAPSRWPLSSQERMRVRCMLDAIVALLYGLDRYDLSWILKDCDHPVCDTADKSVCRQLDPKGFWRVDKTQDPELRHTVLSLAAFDDLQTCIASAGGDRDAGIQAFCDQNDGDGWMLPETLCIADLGMTRTVNVGEYDERARTPQPVRSRMGERFLDWQLAQTPEESWAECERHARALREGLPTAPTEPTTRRSTGRAFPVQGTLGLEN